MYEKNYQLLASDPEWQILGDMMSPQLWFVTSYHSGADTSNKFYYSTSNYLEWFFQPFAKLVGQSFILIYVCSAQYTAVYVRCLFDRLHHFVFLCLVDLVQSGHQAAHVEVALPSLCIGCCCCQGGVSPDWHPHSSSRLLYWRKRWSLKCIHNLINQITSTRRNQHSYGWLPDSQTDGRRDRHRTKWSLCAAMPRRRHKKFDVLYFDLPSLMREQWQCSG